MAAIIYLTRPVRKGRRPDDDFVDYVNVWAGGDAMSPEHSQEYLRQMEESEGFDITLDLEEGRPVAGPIVPLRRDFNTPQYIELSNMDIDKFNSENATNYILVKIVSVNVSLAAGLWCYITFEARNNDDAVNTFQALAWSGVTGSKYVRFCRLKKLKSGDTRSPDSDVKATQ